jgi:hypothetical protein
MKFSLILFCLFAIQACKHPLAIQGQGDVVEVLSGLRGCSLEEFQADSPRCTDNEVLGEDYVVSYQAVPRPDWGFVGWEGTACSASSAFLHCDYTVSQAWVDFTNLTWPGTVLAPTVAVFAPLGAVTLSATDGLPGEFITASSDNLVPGEVAEVLFEAVDGSFSVSSFVMIAEEGRANFPTPVYFDAQGNLAAGAVTISIAGDTAVQTFYIEPLLPLSTNTRGLIWLANATANLERLQQAIANLELIEEDSGSEASTHKQALREQAEALQAIISGFQANGVISFTTTDGRLIEVSGDALQQLDSLLLHTTVGLSIFLEGSIGPSNNETFAGQRAPAASVSATGLNQHFREVWAEIQETFADSEVFNDPGNPTAEQLRGIREAIDSIPDVVDAGIEAGRTKGVAFLAAVATLGNATVLVGDAALAEVATVGNLALTLLQSTAAGLQATINEINTSSLANQGREEFDTTRELAIQLIAVATEMGKSQLTGLLGLLSGLDDLRNSTLDMLNGLEIALCNQLPTNPFCGDTNIGSITGVYETSYGTMSLSQSGDGVSGSYNSDNGKIFGTLAGNVLNGFWTEDGSAITCSSLRGGEDNWGTVTFDFTTTGFSGSWDYCGNSGGGFWNGTKQ